jgi:hypothetical protein
LRSAGAAPAALQVLRDEHSCRLSGGAQIIAGQLRPQTCTPLPQSVLGPTPHVIEQPPPLGHRSAQPVVPLHVAWQAPPSHVVSQPPVPLQTISEPMPTWKLHSWVPLHVAVQSMPHAAVQPAVLLHTTPQ